MLNKKTMTLKKLKHLKKKLFGELNKKKNPNIKKKTITKFM
jgi:hypothetical protein